MAKGRENIALEWTRAELIETLGSARRTLEAYADAQPADGAPASAVDLAPCVDALHQTHGVFVMLELEAAATFAAHLEAVARALAARSLADPAGAAECLMQGLLELPDYLDALRAGLGDTIVPLLPVLNELRQHLREPPFAPPEVSLAFAAAPSEGALERFIARDGLEKVRKVRAVYQQVLLSALKGGIAAPAVETLQKVAVSMQRLCEGTPGAVLWQAFDEYLRALRDGLGQRPGALGAEAVKLLRCMDSELRLLAQEGAQALARPAPAELLQQLASAAAARGRSSPFLADLEQALAATDMSEALASSGRRALASAAAALRDDLASVRDQVDLTLRRGVGGQPVEREALIKPLKQISSTMSLLGLESSRAIVAEQLDALGGPEIDAEQLTVIADALGQVDRNLASLSQGGKDDAELILDAAQQAVLVEARHGLELLKQGIVDYVSSHWDIRHLQGLPGHLADVAKALRIIPLTDAADLMDRCVGYIVQELVAGHVPDWRELDRFAGAVSGVDYYLERLAMPGGAGAEEILVHAQHSLAELLAELEPFAPTVSVELEVEALEPEERAPGLVAKLDALTAASEPPAFEVPAALASVDEFSACEALQDGARVAGAEAVTAPKEPQEPKEPEEEVEAEAPPSIPEASAVADIAEPPAPVEGIELRTAEADAAEVAGPSAAVPAAFGPEGPVAAVAGGEAWSGSEELPDVGELPEVEELPLAELAPPVEAESWETIELDAVPEPEALEGSAGGEPLTVMPAEPIPVEAGPLEPAPVDVGHAPIAAAERSPDAAAAHARLATLEDEFEVDDEILAVFLEEVDEVLAAIDTHLPPWQRDRAEGQHVLDLRRAFHTLKGSARLVGANVLGEVGWAVEQMLNRVLEGDIEASAAVLAAVATARGLIPELRTAFGERRQPVLDSAAELVALAERLATGWVEVVSVVSEPPEQPEPPARAAEAPDIWREFREEARDHLRVVTDAREFAGYRIDEAVVRAFHTLAGGAAMVGAAAISELARGALDLVQVVLGVRASASVSGPVAEFLDAACATLAGDLEKLHAEARLEPHTDLIAVAARLSQEVPVAPLVADLLALPGLDTLLRAQQALDDWRYSGFDSDRHSALMSVLQAVVELARAPDYTALTELAVALQDAGQRLAGPPLDASNAGVLQTGFERLLAQIDALIAGQPLLAAPDVVSALADLAAAPLVPLIERIDVVEDLRVPAPREPAEVIAPELFAEPVEPDAELEAEAREEAETTAAADEIAFAAAASIPAGAGAMDEELLGIFLEEAEELLDEIDRAAQGCAQHADPHAAIEALLRALHTLKGGARLAGLGAAGDAAHDFESWLIALRDAGSAFDAPALARLHEYCDGLAALIASAGGTASPAQVPSTSEREIAPAPEAFPEAAAPPAPALPVAEAPAAQAERRPMELLPPGSARVAAPARGTWYVPVAMRPEPTRPAAGTEATAAEGAAAAHEGAVLAAAGAERRGAEESVRVRAALLEQLVNLAGESSIIRGRVQQGLAEFGGALDEMEITIQRLRDQLRRLEIETEAQILFRRERPDSPGYEDFDPLELDRYSQLQQLSRSLSESASDMLDLKETLRQRAADTDALLVQQSRINTQLQEGLMRSRMVPFSRLLPRLRRTVRQVAQDLGKSVELVAYNVEGELDRSLLDRMVAPLEHMLRNAVDHGIETADARRASGKPETGHIELRLAREGGDVVIEICDDGAGIDVDRVRSKALAQGLMATDAALSDDEIRQFIFAPGFSTARSVTQISGRGVGMDAALSEVKQLGGSIGVTSEPGRGTAFSVRVPFTVSVNRALMVSVGEDLYAVPLNTIEGIVLVRGEELAPLTEGADSAFEYAGVSYEVRHLGEYFGRPARTGPIGGSVPVVLVRSGDSAVAVQVDGVQGSREIVVKGLGPQLAGLAGISGATILGDGGVVVILDLPALIRARRKGAIAERKRGVSVPHARAVLVVDDSVTVRKVTSRLLERQGMEVMLAKDGVEAIAQLQERKPDIMLLDIEMPRMDGFEVLRHVRHDPRLADLPVIMISSRTGAKHKDRAAELGVSHFLGKPFQEVELLNVIDQFLE